MSKLNTGVKRRGFFTAIAAGGAATLAPLPGKAAAQPAAPKPSATRPTAATIAANPRRLPNNR